MELARGIVRQRRRNPEFTRDLTVWLEQTLTWFDDRVIPVNAATAIEHDLAVVTRSVQYFEPTGAKVLNPFDNPDPS